MSSNGSDEEEDSLNNFKPTQKCNAPYEFNFQQILKERQEECEFWRKNDELNEEMKVVDELYYKAVNEVYVPDINLPSPNLGYHIFDYSKYNLLFNNNLESGIKNVYSQQLLIMSIEKDQLEANIHFLQLMQANWTPVLNVCVYK